MDIMKWMQRPGRLIKRLSSLTSNGKKLCEIRKAKRASQKDLLDHLNSNGVDIERKILALMEEGAKPVLSYMIDPWLGFLETTAKEAMISVEDDEADSSAGEAAAMPSSSSAPKRSTAKKATGGNSRDEQRIQFINYCETLCLEFFIERNSDGLIVISVFNNEPVPKEVVEESVKPGSEIARAWLDQPAKKYENSPNPEDRKTVPRRVTVTLK
jgi:hypothetical protein